MNPEVLSSWNMLSALVSFIDDSAGPTAPDRARLEISVAARLPAGVSSPSWVSAAAAPSFSMIDPPALATSALMKTV